MHIVSYFTATPEALSVLREETASTSDVSWKNSLRRFWSAEQGYCDERFKLVPSIVSPTVIIIIDVYEFS